ncbi:unnamed protein product [Laminaria digitata]
MSVPSLPRGGSREGAMMIRFLRFVFFQRTAFRIQLCRTPYKSGISAGPLFVGGAGSAGCALLVVGFRKRQQFLSTVRSLVGCLAYGWLDCPGGPSCDGWLVLRVC